MRDADETGHILRIVDLEDPDALGGSSLWSFLGDESDDAKPLIHGRHSRPPDWLPRLATRGCARQDCSHGDDPDRGRDPHRECREVEPTRITFHITALILPTMGRSD